MPEVADLGAGEDPHPDSTVTVDIRNDLDHVDYPGVDLSSDKIPLEINS